MATANAMERKRTVGKYNPPAGNQAGAQPGFSAAVQTQINAAKPPSGGLNLDASFGDMAALWGQGYDQGLRGDELNQFTQHGYNQIYPNGNKSTPKTDTGNVKTDPNAPLMSTLKQYVMGLNSLPQKMYNQTVGEINTQSDAGRTTINESTQRALEALGAQSNPYTGLQMANVGPVTDPMAAYSQAVGTPQGGIQALQNMLQSQNAATSGGFGNLAQLLGASQQAAQQSRIGDVNVARTGAQQDLATNQRMASLQALQQSQNTRQGQQTELMQQLLGLAGQGIDVSKIMAMFGGQ